MRAGGKSDRSRLRGYIRNEQNRPVNERWYSRLAATSSCAIILMSAALWNGYPIVYSDTASYIISGFHLETLIDRPITYGLFIRACGFNGWSLWTVALAQSMILAHVIGLSLKSIGVERAFARAMVIVPTALLTGLPFVCGQIITDVFTPILFFTLYLLLFAKGLSRGNRITLFALFLLSFAMHMSHVAIAALMLVATLMARRWMERRSFHVPSWSSVGILVLLAVVGTLVMGTALAKSKHSFFAARMAEAGILQRYLEEHCATGEFKLCARLGSIPRDANAFLWDEDTPLNVYANRQEMEDELGRIASGSLREPDLAWMHTKAAASSIGNQFTRFAVGDGNGAFGEGTVLNERIDLFFPSEAERFDSARQMSGARFQAPLVAANHFYDAVMMISLVVTVALFVRRGSSPMLTASKRLGLFLLTGLVLNVCINAGLVMVADRFGTKTAWLLPFTAMLLASGSVPYFRRHLYGT